MDQIDDAAEVTRLFTAAALSKRRPVEKSYGYCLSCREPAKGAYCDEHCRQDAEREDSARIRNGEG